VKLLSDQNLSRALVVRLRDAFPDSEHVAALGLDTVPGGASGRRFHPRPMILRGHGR
jgi:hypothetical protein